MATSQGSPEVDLTELGVISRFSLAVRAPRADRDELVALLLDDVAWLRSLPSAGPPADDGYDETFDDSEYDTPVADELAQPEGAYDDEPEPEPAPRRRAAPSAVARTPRAVAKVPAKVPAKAPAKAPRRAPAPAEAATRTAATRRPSGK